MMLAFLKYAQNGHKLDCNRPILHTKVLGIVDTNTLKLLSYDY